jgi:hypothetical protein
MSMIRVVHFADIVNRHDFIDNVVRHADSSRFAMGVCVRSAETNIAASLYPPEIPCWDLHAPHRRQMARAAWRLAANLRRWQADIVHTHHFDQALIGWLATRLYPHTRLVIGRHYSDAIYRSSSGVKRKLRLLIERMTNSAASIMKRSTASLMAS